MLVLLLILILLIFLWFFRDYIFSLLTFLSLRLEGREPDFPVLNSLRDDLIHERKKKIASLKMILSTWEKGESISTHLNYFKDLTGQLKGILKDQRKNLLTISSDPFLWVRLNHRVSDVMKGLGKIEKNKERISLLKDKLDSFSEFIEKELDRATQKFTFSLNEVIKEAAKIVRTEKDRILKEKGITIEEKYEEIGDRFRLSYKGYKDWQKLISNLIRNGVEAMEAKLLATSHLLQAGVVRVLVEGKGEEVTVVVEDNGVGMDEKTKEYFYKRGFTKGKETGLGLGITEETVEFINRYGAWKVESKINEGTRIEIKINKEKAKEQDLKVEDSKAFVIKLRSRRVIFAIAGILVLVIGSGLYFQFNKYARFWEDWNPEFFEAKDNLLIVKNESKKILWDLRLPAAIILNPISKEPIIKLSDLNRDGKSEVLVGITHTPTATGKVLCYNYRREELWEFPCGEYGIYRIDEEFNTGYFFPLVIESEDIDADSKQEVIISSEHARWFPAQVVVLDDKGNKLSEYWHPGVIECIYCLDFDGDGGKEIILGGINNRIGWKPVISILDPKKASGQAIPYIALKKIEKAKEKWYIVFPHIKKRLPDESKWETFLSSVRKVKVFSRENRIDVELADWRLYFLKLNFEFNSVYLSKGFLNYKKDFPFPYDITEEDEENWKNIEVYKEGVRIR